VRTVEVLPDSARLARAGAEHFVALATGAIATRGRFAVALSGGETPRRMHAELSRAPFLDQVDWPRVHVFWGDERCVPPEHPDSNYRMARETLLDRVPLPAANIHRIRGEIAPQQAAAEYEQELRAFFAGSAGRAPSGDAGGPPRFDLILLGLGEDGHTASLFPRTPALRERRRWVVAQHVSKLDAWRITLTLPVINAAADVIFLVSGAKKAETLQRVLADAAPADADELPARMVAPTAGRVAWLVDAAAAALLRD
jgi:6-phosphogluconolactonase